MTIEEQQKISRKILKSLRQVDPAAVIAGGAPRDWKLGREARDLDFFVHVSNQHSLRRVCIWFSNLLRMSLRSVFTEICQEYWGRSFAGTLNHVEFQTLLSEQWVVSSTEDQSDGTGDYRKGLNPLVRDVLEGYLWEDEECKLCIQIILLTSPCEIWRAFPFNMCQIAWDGKEYHSLPLFDLGLRDKLLVQTLPTPLGREHYKQKILDYFKDYRFFDVSEGRGGLLLQYLGVEDGSQALEPRKDADVGVAITPLAKGVVKHEDLRDAFYVLEQGLAHPETARDVGHFLLRVVTGVAQ